MKTFYYNIHTNGDKVSYCDMNIYLDFVQNLICSLRDNGPLCSITADISYDKIILDTDAECIDTTPTRNPYIHIIAVGDDIDRISTAIEKVSDTVPLLAVEKICDYGELMCPEDISHNSRDTECYTDIEIVYTKKGKTLIVSSSENYDSPTSIN